MQTGERPDLAVLHDAYCLTAFEDRRFRHAQLWQMLGTLADEAPGLEREEIGRSVEGRPLYAVRFGTGPIRVLMWSQMHGDEPSHTMAIADLFAYWAREPEDPRVQKLRDGLTIVAVPMLNPDGAERFLRHNAQGLDLNEDARAWRSPEMRAMRDLAIRFRPDFGFNLHDQDVRTRVGKSDRLTALALLACPIDEVNGDNEARLRAKRLCGIIREAVEPLVGDHVSRYSETYEPRGIGEWMQNAGVSTVLLESGSWPGDREKQVLRTMSFVAILGALEAIADGRVEGAPLERYASLVENDRNVFDVLLKGATICVEGIEPYRADIGIDFRVPLDAEDGTISEIGDLSDALGRRVLDAGDLFLFPKPDALDDGDGPPRLRPGCAASFTLRRSLDGDTPVAYDVSRGWIEER